MFQALTIDVAAIKEGVRAEIEAARRVTHKSDLDWSV